MTDIPTHIAIIMDGNGRWARSRRLPRRVGHHEGLKALRRTVEHCARLKLRYLTVFAFSSENWNRPENEIRRLMELFVKALDKEIAALHKNEIRVRFVGELSAFADELQVKMARAERLTRDNGKMTFNIACNFGGRWDLTQACKKLCEEVQQGTVNAADVDADMLTSRLALAGVPEPDLLIRSGGEQRLSNFLLWQLAYCELYFTNTLWPDFDGRCIDEAIQEFKQRERRFGRTSDQVSEARCA